MGDRGELPSLENERLQLGGHESRGRAEKRTDVRNTEFTFCNLHQGRGTVLPTQPSIQTSENRP